MFKNLLRIPYWCINVIWIIVKNICQWLWLIVRISSYLFYPVWWLIKLCFRRRETSIPDLPIPVIEPEPAVRKNKKSISKIGSLVPQEEDHRLRSFTVMNSEGELFLIDTSAKGSFYGSVWTKIFASYQEQICLRGRIVRYYYDEFLQQHGFEVKISNIKAFLPLAESMRVSEQQPINTILAVTQIFPESSTVVVSSRVAYHRSLGNKTPSQGDKVQVIYWDYDDNNIYCLLPANYMGISVRDGLTNMKLEEMMGKITSANIESICSEKREVQLTVLDENDIHSFGNAINTNVGSEMSTCSFEEQ